MDLKSVIEVLERIESTSSRNDKEKILYENKDNELLKSVLWYSLNHEIHFGIQTKSIDESFSRPSLYFKYDNILDLLEYLSENNTGSHKEKEIASSFLYGYEDDRIYFKWIKRILLRDLRIGVKQKTVNKVYGKGFVPMFEVCLCKPYSRPVSNMLIEAKEDGVRCIAIRKSSGDITLYTRNGKVISGFSDIELELDFIMPEYSVFDGEIKLPTFDKTMENLFRKEENKKAEYKVWDMLSLEEFVNQKCNSILSIRKLNLDNLFQSSPRLNHITQIESISCSDINEAHDIAFRKGYEGVIIKDLNSGYEFKRGYSWQKLKVMQTGDFEIVAMQEGTGKYSGMLGAVFIDVNGEEVKVGSGFSDKDREHIWENQFDYLGSWIEVQYQAITKDGSLRFPSFKGFRPDKH